MTCGHFGTKGSFPVLLSYKGTKQPEKYRYGNHWASKREDSHFGIAEIIGWARISCPSEINVTALRVGADQFYAQLVSYVHALPVD